VSDYVVGHVQEALAQTGETDVHVAVHGTRLVLTGTVTTEERRDVVLGIASSHAGDLELSDLVNVLRPRAPEGQEQL
jgi:hypothetical protein